MENMSCQDDCTWIEDGATYHATMHDMENPEELIEKLTIIYKNKAVKIVPPSNYKPTVKSEDEILKVKLKDLYNQTVSQMTPGYYHFLKGKTPPNKFKTVGDLKNGGGRPTHLRDATFTEIEKAAWSELRKKGKDPTKSQHLSYYGSDEEGTFMSNHSKLLTLAKFPSILSRVMMRYQSVYIGLTTPMTYFGRWCTFFVDHKEDYDLGALNYLHYGEQKIWYTRDSDEACDFENSVNDDLKNVMDREMHACTTPLRHKCILVDLKVMKEKGIKVFRHIQKPGELMYLPPGAYHSGFNLGFNIAESVNGANKDWIRWGLFAKVCDKTISPVLKMEFFVYEYMHESFQSFLNNDLELINPSTQLLEKVTAPPENDEEASSYAIRSCSVDAVLAAKVDKSVRKLYVALPGYKIWMESNEISNFTWTQTGQPVEIPEDFYDAVYNHPSDIIINGVRSYRNIIPGGPMNFYTSNHRVTLEPLVRQVNTKRRRITTSMKKISTLECIDFCGICKRDLTPFSSDNERKRHIKNCMERPKIPCEKCNTTFTRASDLKVHLKNCK